ncbi:hypothetical protein OM076_43160 [Solirubrobacter ginsenosidimutans]|uniref:Uncharacterized protein n=1 Tax=Solirubrobacter ginsenosidimutans TaxID=490573 RepID=A0A9X3N286_9ACTN|nr:hypothetical protein [Solirubrobacter ginsenosidimutans]MDA0167139.1 hypothetical protein [Solirubrobacter ginsenosidimutans]
MSSHERLRRRAAPPESEQAQHPGSSRRPPNVAALLALQRSAGNRAVISRLLADDAINEVKIPQSYADRRLHWDGTYQNEDAPEQRVFDIITGGGGREHFKTGLNYPLLSQVTTVADAELGVRGAKVWDNKGDKGLGGTFKAAAIDTHKLLHHYADNQIKTAAEATIDLVMDPEDYLPEAPDLPDAHVAVNSPRKGEETKAAQERARQEREASRGNKGGKRNKPKESANPVKTYWEFMCVLIALLKIEGFACAKVAALAAQPPTSLLAGVQVMHDHYMGLNVPLQYDDSSARRAVMNDWGYQMVFAGRSRWTELPGRVVLTPGAYIFDIKGHTVYVDVLKDIGPKTKIGDVKQFFKCNSDPKNFSLDEFHVDQRVSYIWKK